MPSPKLDMTGKNEYLPQSIVKLAACGTFKRRPERETTAAVPNSRANDEKYKVGWGVGGEIDSTSSCTYHTMTIHRMHSVLAIAPELCEGRGGCPGIHVPNGLSLNNGFCGRKAPGKEVAPALLRTGRNRFLLSL